MWSHCPLQHGLVPVLTPWLMHNVKDLSIYDMAASAVECARPWVFGLLIRAAKTAIISSQFGCRRYACLCRTCLLHSMLNGSQHNGLDMSSGRSCQMARDSLSSWNMNRRQAISKQRQAVGQQRQAVGNQWQAVDKQRQASDRNGKSVWRVCNLPATARISDVYAPKLSQKTFERPSVAGSPYFHSSVMLSP